MSTVKSVYHKPTSALKSFIKIASVLGVVAGCSPYYKGSSLEPTMLGDTYYIGSDASRRAIIDRKPENAVIGAVQPKRIICTEPSPDVALAFANSFGAALQTGKTAATFSSTAATSLAQLAERTASIQLIRERMYQSCLAYSNGAITGTTYNVVMSDLDATMVTLLLGESAAGAFGRNLAQITNSITTEPATIETQKDNPKTADVDESQITKLTRSKTIISSAPSAASIGKIDGRHSQNIAASLVTMNSDFLNRNRSDAVITACLSELGLSELGDTKEIIKNKIAFYEGLMTDEKDQVKSLEFEKNLVGPLKDARDREIEKKKKEIAEYKDKIENLKNEGPSSVFRGRSTKLMVFCRDNLRDIMKEKENERKVIANIGLIKEIIKLETMCKSNYKGDELAEVKMNIKDLNMNIENAGKAIEDINTELGEIPAKVDGEDSKITKNRAKLEDNLEKENMAKEELDKKLKIKQAEKKSIVKQREENTAYCGKIDKVIEAFLPTKTST